MGYLGKEPIRIKGKLFDSNNHVGTASSVLTSTGTGVSWTSTSDLSGIVTSITAGSGISVDQSTGNVTITATGGGGGSSGIQILEEGSSVGTGITILDFVGSGVTATIVNNTRVKIDITSGGGGGGGGDGASIDLGTPTDSSLTDGLLTFTTTTKVTDAIDELNEVLSKLAPAKPPNLSTFTISLQSSYSATESSSGTLRSNVTSDSTPRINNVTQFWDGESGTLTSEVDGSVTGTKGLSAASDTGTNGDLVITADSGYPTSGNGANFWQALTAYIQRVTALSVGSHTMQMKHSTTGNTNVLTFYVDNPTTVTITNTSYDISSSSTTKVSGVPTLSSGTTFTVDFTVNNAIKEFYNSTRIATVSGSSILSASVNHSISGVQADSPVPVTAKTLTVGSNKYSESPTITFTGYNSQNIAGTGSNLSLSDTRVDTVSTSESTKRKLSGSGQYPTSGYGATYDSNQALNTGVYVNEMQYINGQFKYPPAVNYSTFEPGGGPNYTSNMGTGTRWWCYQHTTSLNAISAFTLTISGSSGFSGTETSGVEIYARVDGSSGTNGWINCNSAYPGVGSPTNDGDPALVVGSSSATSKRVTFGTAAKTGTLYIRIGFPSGSTKYFTGVSISLG